MLTTTFSCSSSATLMPSRCENYVVVTLNRLGWKKLFHSLKAKSKQQTSSAYSISNNSDERNYCKVKLNIIETRLNYWSKVFIVVRSKSPETLEDGKFSFLSNLLCFLRQRNNKTTEIAYKLSH